jgi:hypothetical protein
MGLDKIAAFYDDPVKRAYDAFCAKKAYGLRSQSIERTLPWVALRWTKFVLHWLKGALKRGHQRSVEVAPALVPAQDPAEGRLASYTPAPNPRTLVQ